MNDLLDTVALVVYNLTILGTTVYLVQFCGWNPWWFLLAVCLLGSKKLK